MTFRKIYVLAPFAAATGGIELAHQLVDVLRNRGVEAYIVYVDNQQISYDQTLTSNYKKYNLKTSKIIEDSSDNLLIMPEIYFDFIFEYKYIQFGCWWMSVDNHYRKTNVIDSLKFFKKVSDRIRIIKGYIGGGLYHYKNTIKDLKRLDGKIYHFYQSHYAQYHLYSLGFSRVLPLSDYINAELISCDSGIKKENIILYNPKKGYSFTKKIIAKMPQYKFIALQGFNRNELNELFDKAKIYIDFGDFPGKDRLPREAALHKCCIITGKNGASYFYEDLPIDGQYKFHVSSKNIKNICTKIEFVLQNYESSINDFSHFRHIIVHEKKNFLDEIENLFM